MWSILKLTLKSAKKSLCLGRRKTIKKRNKKPNRRRKIRGTVALRANDRFLLSKGIFGH